jgi:hypothetical protein
VSRDAITKVLDIERTLESASKEPSEWRHKRCESSHNQTVDLEWSIRDGGDASSNLVVVKRDQYKQTQSRLTNVLPDLLLIVPQLE